MVDVIRLIIVLVAGIGAATCFLALKTAVVLMRNGADRICVPSRAMVFALLALISSDIGGSAQLIQWITDDVPFAWYRSPVVSAVVLLQTLAGLTMVNQLYKTRAQ